MQNVQIEVQMKIRKPVSEVFNAFIDPNITTKFWFTKSSGNLEMGKTVTWEWEMYGAKTTVNVKQIVLNKLISIEWGEPQTTVDFEFTALPNDMTYVVIKNYDLKLSDENLIAAVTNNTGGFTTVIDGLKIYLEHGIDPNFIADKFLK